MTIDAADFLRSLQRVAAEVPIYAKQLAGQAATLAYETAHGTTKFKTHRPDGLRSTIRREVRGEWAFRISASANHALYVEEDTKPHTIHAKAARGFVGPLPAGQSRGRRKRQGLLTFKIGGRWISKPFVNHPGTTGTHFMADAAKHAEAFIEANADRGLARVLGS